MITVRATVLCIALALVACGGSSTSSAATIAVSSPVFADGARIPLRYSCEGENVPPPLQWTGVPAAAAEVAVVLLDPDAPRGTFVHWVVTGLPVRAEGGIEEGPLPAGAVEHQTSASQTGYVGPCPPDHGGTHRYSFEVLALRAHVELPANLAPLDAVARLRRAALATGRYRGSFSR